MVVVGIGDKAETALRGVRAAPGKSDRELEDEATPVVGVEVEVETDEGMDTAMLRLDGEGLNDGELGWVLE